MRNDVLAHSVCLIDCLGLIVSGVIKNQKVLCSASNNKVYDPEILKANQKHFLPKEIFTFANIYEGPRLNEEKQPLVNILIYFFRK